MKLFTRKSLQVCAVLMAVMIMLAGCAGTASAPQASGTGEKQVMLDYLQGTLGDFAAIDALIADKDLGLMKDTSSGEAVTSETLTKYLGILQGYDSSITSKLDEIQKRDAPNDPDIAFFKAAEMMEFQTTSDILDEYIQLLKYANSLLDMTASLSPLSNVADTTDLQAVYNAFNTAISSAIDKMKAVEAPSFLKSANDAFIGVLGEMNDAVLYLLQSASLNDPVRLNAANYRFDILTRKLSTISSEFGQDMTTREAKIKADVKSIQAENTGLKNWVQKNIDKLNGN